MTSGERLYDQIERYIANSMGKEELLSFELELKNNSKLQKELDLHKELHNLFNEEDLNHFRGSVQKIIKNQSGVNQKTNSDKWSYLKVAASISIIAIVSFGVYQLFFNKVSNDQLYLSYYEPYEDLISGRNEETESNPLALAMISYNKQDYQTAVNEFEKIDKMNKPLLLLYLGISYLNINQVEKAKEIFTDLGNGNSLFQIEAKWYLALTHLRSGKIEESKSMLKEIIDTKSSSSYVGKAKNLYEEL